MRSTELAPVTRHVASFVFVEVDERPSQMSTCAAPADSIVYPNRVPGFEMIVWAEDVSAIFFRM
jgi:hypothetical protein